MENLSFILAPLFSSKLLIVLFLGTLFGLILGVLPGLGPTTGGALILPFTMTLDPLSAIVLLTAIYCAGTYGGAITAILINTPGTPAAAATCLDGYPLAQKGEAGRALGMATVSSVVGGLLSVLVLIFFAPLLAQLAYEFGQPEYFALAIFGLTMLASIGEGSPIKNLIAGAFGILISTIGKDFMTSIDRFTFGINEVPTLALGIPGSATTAVILTGLIIHGVRPGPSLFREQPDFLYGIFGAMFLANILFFILGFFGAKIFARITLVPNKLLWPMIFTLSVCGTYSLGQSLMDVWIMLFFGIIGFFMRRYGFSVVPVIIGLILGELVEGTLRQSLVIFDGNWFMFFTRPIALTFFIFALIALFFPLLRKKKTHDKF